jgi:hypothetical protein
MILRRNSLVFAEEIEHRHFLGVKIFILRTYML